MGRAAKISFATQAYDEQDKVISMANKLSCPLVFGIEHLGHIDVRWGDGACTRIEWWARDTTRPALAAPCRH
ncbi:hypothetical protein WI29_28820 [Burkholderia ubonensis]|nr:hypothetical protein WI31_22660 [Burkholderia ubonensis]KUZ11886.1 hypothetical protein WI29_28820 [Burkholderia ubonensis]KUZ35680.1 hypothetical protein WI30_11300 [Burkholderia ubonensis]KUZ39207.1 hypothetical protein WI32_11340 [Burkholderia ubonensis]KUZ45669.1 hypothetical protein WI33_27080 [Burkholderia ubonensis]